MLSLKLWEQEPDGLGCFKSMGEYSASSWEEGALQGRKIFFGINGGGGKVSIQQIFLCPPEHGFIFLCIVKWI